MERLPSPLIDDGWDISSSTVYEDFIVTVLLNSNTYPSKITCSALITRMLEVFNDPQCKVMTYSIGKKGLYAIVCEYSDTAQPWRPDDNYFYKPR